MRRSWAVALSALPSFVLISFLLTMAGCRAILGIHDLSDDADGSPSGQTKSPGESADGAPAIPDAAEARRDGDASTSSPPSPSVADARPNADAPPQSSADGQSSANADAQPTARLTANQTTLDFGTLAVGQTVSGGQIQVTNSGLSPTGPLTTGVIGAAFFVVSDGCTGTTLMPALSCHITIGASTAAAGQLSGTVTVSETTTDRLSVAVIARVVVPGTVVISPPTRDFGGVPLGTTGMPETFTVANTGMGATGRLSTLLGGTSSAEFSMTDGCSGKILAPGGTCVVVLTLNPVTAGPKTASLAVTGMPGGTGTAALTGSGLAPASLSIAPTSFAFPVALIDAGAPSTATFVVTNGGSIATSALTTGIQSGSGTANAEFSIKSDTCKGQKIAGMSVCQVTVQFQPATYGSKSASLDVGGGAATATLTGVAEDLVALAVTKTGTGGGTVSDNVAAIQCGATCSAQYPRTTANPAVTLTATPDASSVFTGWSGGGCTGNGMCTVTLAASITVNAQFNALPQPLTVNFHGLGIQSAAIASSPAGISCSGPSCTATAGFNAGTNVVLTVSQASNAIVAWSNGCTGTSCAIRADAPQTVNVTTTNQNIVFVSSQTHSANFAGPAGAETLCNSLAVAAGVPGHFVPFLGTSTVSAFSRLGSARGWIRPDGLPFTDTVSGFQNLVMWYPVSLSELGVSVDEYIYTGVVFPGLAMPTCSDWTSLTGLANGGRSMTEGYGFLDRFGLDCAQGARVACFGTDFATPVTVTPAVGRHVFGLATAFVASDGLTTADALCQTEAKAAGLANPTRFLAALATTRASVVSRFNMNGPTWVRTDGVEVATTPSNFMAGTLIAPPGIDANRSYAWLGSSGGMLAPAASASESCNDWSTASASVKGVIIDSTMAAPNAFTALASFPSGCDTTPALSALCLEN